MWSSARNGVTYAFDTRATLSASPSRSHFTTRSPSEPFAASFATRQSPSSNFFPPSDIRSCLHHTLLHCHFAGGGHQVPGLPENFHLFRLAERDANVLVQGGIFRADEDAVLLQVGDDFVRETLQIHHHEICLLIDVAQHQRVRLVHQ